MHNILLSINGGSTSIKCAAYTTGEKPRQPGKLAQTNIDLRKHAPDDFFDWLEANVDLANLSAIGHRVGQGLNHQRAAYVDNDLLDELRRSYPLDPQHLPMEVRLIEACRKRFPAAPQVACFDAAFHAGLPRWAQVLPIPRRFDLMGVRRYGFHGLSCTYVMGELPRVAGPEPAGGRVIIAHLGGGSSITAVLEGASIDTSMGFSPAGGLPMGSRSGDLDPGAAWYMIRKERLNATAFNHMVNHESGLLGISGLSDDMKTLLAVESSYPAAAEAVAYYCYQVKKYIGAYTAALGGLDALVFTGGIGENAAAIRSRICAGLDHLGIGLDERRNGVHAPVISADGGIPVCVIPTDEEQVIARSTSLLLGLVH